MTSRQKKALLVPLRPLLFAVPPALLFHLRDARQDGGEHLAHRPVGVNLLRYAHDPQSLAAPLPEHVDTVA